MSTYKDKNLTKNLFFKLKKKAQEAPTHSGVYLIKDSFNRIIYIGKAKNLKLRFSSYVHILNKILNRTEPFDGDSSYELRSDSIKTKTLVRKMCDVDFQVTSSEIEAFLKEAMLIKKHKPKYNVRLKDDKAYPYLRLDIKKDFPRIELSRRVKYEGAIYFGPYTQTFVLRELMDFVNKTFLIRDCSDHFMKSTTRPCLTHQMGFCDAPCVGWISKTDYRRNIKKALSFLSGKSPGLKKKLEIEMKKASRSEAFEKAARIRDRLKNLEIFSTKHQKLMLNEKKDQDVVLILGREETGILIKFLHIRSSYVIGKNSHFISPYDFNQELPLYPLSCEDKENKLRNSELGEWVSTYLFQFYEQNFIPNRILISEPLSNKHVHFIEGLLKKKRKSLSLVSPSSKSFNEEDEMFLQEVRLEAKSVLKQLSQRFNSQLLALKEIKSFFQLDRTPYRIEAFDVSHFQGSHPVASCIVFEGGEFKKSDYRHYKLRYDLKKNDQNKKLNKVLKKKAQKIIRSSDEMNLSGGMTKITGQDDFMSMREVLERRFKDANTYHLPDLIVVDGGKGQLSQALQVLKSKGLENKVFAFGMAKARVDRDFESARVSSSKERFYLPHRKGCLFLPENSRALQLLILLRDEAHRFALRLQRKQRKKEFKEN